MSNPVLVPSILETRELQALKPYRIVQFPVYLSGVEEQMNLMDSQGYEFVCMVKNGDGGLFKLKPAIERLGLLPEVVVVPPAPIAVAPKPLPPTPPKVEPARPAPPKYTPNPQKGYKR